MRISDWSSDVCSSDLIGRQRLDPPSLAHREVDEPSIRAPGNFISATKRLGRRVADQLAHHRMPVAARAFGCERKYEQLLALPIEPAVPSSEARRLGNEGVSTRRSRWSPNNSKKNTSI